jgi:hypothetical protein
MVGLKVSRLRSIGDLVHNREVVRLRSSTCKVLAPEQLRW